MKWTPIDFCPLFLFLLLSTDLSLLAQEKDVGVQPAALDTSVTDSLSQGLSPNSAALLQEPGRHKRIQPADIGIRATVNYSARTIDSRKSESIIYLIGDAEVKYKDITVKAGKITIRWNENLLIAEGIPDSLRAGEASPADSQQVKHKGLPVFTDGKETIVGEQMEYNFKSEKGRILRGRTQFQKGYYYGSAVKRVAASVFNVADGVYTTCDAEEPHFHFKSKKMKVIKDDKVIAKPVTFYLGKIPLAIFPFAMFSTKENGRQSGIIIPQFGTSPQEGRYLRNMGYYFAASEYMDMRLTMDFFERTGVLFRGHANYAKRYKFTGSLDGSFTDKDFGTRKERRWNLGINHRQTIDENTSLAVNASFQSNSTFYRELSNNRNERLNRQIRSNATLTKRWGEGRNSLTVNLAQTKDIESKAETITLPKIQFTRSRSQIFPFKEAGSGRSKKDPKWYNYLQYDYKGFLGNEVRKDTTDKPDDIDRVVRHDVTLSYTNPKKLFGALSLSQSFVYDEDWFDRRDQDFTLVDSTNQFVSEQNKGFFIRRLFRYSASASTNLYGTFFPNVFSITALRHKMTPSISFSYRPDFSESSWGYYETKKDAAGKERRLDRYGGTPNGKLMSMGFGMTNLFQMKLGKGQKEKKINLFNLNFRSGYNFAADSLKLSNLSTALRANPRRNISVSMSMNHSFYDFNPETGRTEKDFLFDKGGLFNSLRLNSLRFDMRWSLGGRSSRSGEGRGASTLDSVIDEGAPGILQRNAGPTAGGQYQDTFAPESAFSAFDIPWRATLAFSYGVNKSNPLNTTRTAYVDLSNVELQLTQKWRIGYRLRYDFERAEVVDQRISFYRDLHCWEARFDWNPSGIGEGYYFIVNIKAPHLRDLKVERRGGTTSIFKPF